MSQCVLAGSQSGLCWMSIGPTRLRCPAPLAAPPSPLRPTPEPIPLYALLLPSVQGVQELLPRPHPFALRRSLTSVCSTRGCCIAECGPCPWGYVDKQHGRVDPA